ncbi:MAG: lysophospholipid acyltransferase family protein [bacterium]|nr:lysophospholipid acyltransferase family protein [bacterium]
MSFSDEVVANALLSLGGLSRTLPAGGRKGLGKYFGKAMMLASAKRLAITRDNVLNAFPQLSDSERRSIVHEAYQNLGIVLAEVLAMPSLTREQAAAAVVFPNIELLRSRVEQRKSTILVSAHYGNWEYLAMSGGVQLNTSLTIVVHPQRNERVSTILNSYRTRFGNNVVSMHNAARTLIRTIQDGGTIAFLVDQHADPVRDAWIDFFGRATPTYEAPAALALRYNVPIMTAFAERMENGSYAAPLHEIPMDDLENSADGIRTLTERHVRALEEAIRKRPGLWSWQHRRWRDSDRLVDMSTLSNSRI